MARLSHLIAVPSLGLRLLVAGETSQEITWAATTELLDLSPYLEGGEVVLTAGLSLAPDDPRWNDFVAGLSRARATALGFAVQVAHPRVPEPLLAACAKYRIALFEVPPPTPFIAISKAVAQLLDNDELHSMQRSLAQQRRILGQAFSSAGPLPVLASLRTATGAEAALYRADGSIESHTAGFAARPGMAVAARELLSGESATVHGEQGPSHAWAMHTLGLRGQARRTLVVSGQRQATLAEQGAITAAALVLSLQEERSRAQESEDQARRERIARLLFRGELSAAEAALGVLAPGEQLPSRVRVIGVSGDPESVEQFRADPANTSHFFGCRLEAPFGAAPVEPFWVLCPSHGDALGALLALAQRFSLDVLVGLEVPLPEAGASWLAARSRLGELVPRTPGSQHPPVVRWADREGTVLSALLQVGANGVAPHLLGPLAHTGIAGDSAESESLAAEIPVLRNTLEAFLRHNGQRGPAANALQVHRNTLRNRIERIETLTGCSLDDPDDRAELWLALRAFRLQQAAQGAHAPAEQPVFA